MLISDMKSGRQAVFLTQYLLYLICRTAVLDYDLLVRVVMARWKTAEWEDE